MRRLHVFRALDDRGIAIIPTTSHDEASRRWTSEPWAGPEGTRDRAFRLGDWHVDVQPLVRTPDEQSRRLDEFYR
jgi:hypothetical protein